MPLQIERTFLVINHSLVKLKKKDTFNVSVTENMLNMLSKEKKLCIMKFDCFARFFDLFHTKIVWQEYLKFVRSFDVKYLKTFEVFVISI
jgi:hypothetical protein